MISWTFIQIFSCILFNLTGFIQRSIDYSVVYESLWATSTERGGYQLSTPTHSYTTHTHTNTCMDTHPALSLTGNSVAGSESYAGMLAAVNAPHYTQRKRERKGGRAIGQRLIHTHFPSHTLPFSQTAAAGCVQDDMPQPHQSVRTRDVIVGLTVGLWD